MENYDGENFEQECLVGDGVIRYRMVCIDAALGSRAYSLLKSTDGGASWQVQERDPFGEQWGMMLQKDLPAFFVELGLAVQRENTTFDPWFAEAPERLRKIAEKYFC